MLKKLPIYATLTALALTAVVAAPTNASTDCSTYDATTLTENLCEIVFDSNTTWDVPALPYGQLFDILVIGAGGGGGAAVLSGSYTESGGGGGGGGDAQILLQETFTAGLDIAITVGMSGAAGTTGDGADGGDTSFGSTLAQGGKGGKADGTGGGSGSAEFGGAAAAYNNILVPGGGGSAINPGADAASFVGSFYNAGSGGFGKAGVSPFFGGSVGGGSPKILGSGGGAGLGSSFGGTAEGGRNAGNGATATTPATLATDYLGGGGGGGYTDGTTTRAATAGADGSVQIRFIIKPLTTIEVDVDFADTLSNGFTGSLSLILALAPHTRGANSGLVLGGYLEPTNVTGAYGLGRIGLDGLPDQTFNTNFAAAQADANNGIPDNVVVSAIHVRDDNSIIFGTEDGALHALNADGTYLDVNFGVLPASQETVRVIEEISGNRIFIGGQFDQAGFILNQDLTATSITNLSTVASNNSPSIRAIAESPTGDLFLAGSFAGLVNSNTCNNIVKVSSAGVLNTEFCQNISATNTSNLKTSIALDADNGLIVGGSWSYQSPALQRFTLNGTLDETFTDNYEESFGKDAITVNKIALRQNGDVWIVTDGNGVKGMLFRLDKSGKIKPAVLSVPIANSDNGYVFHAAGNDIYVGGFITMGGELTTYSGTILKLSPKTVPLLIDKTPPVSGQQGAPFETYTFTASGDEAPTFELVSGTLPNGLSLDENSGELTGTPIASGTFTFVVRTVNSRGEDSTESITITISPSQGTQGGKSRKVIYFDSESAALRPEAKKVLRKIVARLEGRVLRTSVTGFVAPLGSITNDRSLATARAKNIKAFLKKSGLDGRVIVKFGGRSKEKDERGRKVVIQFTIARVG